MSTFSLRLRNKSIHETAASILPAVRKGKTEKEVKIVKKKRSATWVRAKVVKPKISADRLRHLLFQTLESYREYLAHTGEFSDWRDADDYLFSNLDIEIGEMEELYADAVPEIICYGCVYGGSCYEDEQSPKNYHLRMGMKPEKGGAVDDA